MDIACVPTSGVAHLVSREASSTSTTALLEPPKRQYATGPESKPYPRSVTRVEPVVTPPGGPPLTLTSSMRSP